MSDNDVKLGAEARRILESDVFQNAFDALRGQIVSDWERSPPLDAEGREKLYMMLIGLNAARNQLTHLMRGEELVREELRREEQLNARSAAKRRTPH